MALVFVGKHYETLVLSATGNIGSVLVRNLLIVQADNLLDEQVWVSALGSPATDTVPFNKGRVAYLGVRVGF